MACTGIVLAKTANVPNIIKRFKFGLVSFTILQMRGISGVK